MAGDNGMLQDEGKDPGVHTKTSPTTTGDGQPGTLPQLEPFSPSALLSVGRPAFPDGQPGPPPPGVLALAASPGPDADSVARSGDEDSER